MAAKAEKLGTRGTRDLFKTRAKSRICGTAKPAFGLFWDMGLGEEQESTDAKYQGTLETIDAMLMVHM